MCFILIYILWPIRFLQSLGQRPPPKAEEPVGGDASLQVVAMKASEHGGHSQGEPGVAAPDP